MSTETERHKREALLFFRSGCCRPTRQELTTLADVEKSWETWRQALTALDEAA